MDQGTILLRVLDKGVFKNEIMGIFELDITRVYSASK